MTADKPSPDPVQESAPPNPDEEGLATPPAVPHQGAAVVTPALATDQQISPGGGGSKHAAPASAPPSRVLATAFGAYVVMVAFLITAMFVSSPPDLSKLGVSGLVTAILGIIVTPRTARPGLWWWALVAATAAGLLLSGALALWSNGSHPEAPVVFAAFVGAISGLLADGNKLGLSTL